MSYVGIYTQQRRNNFRSMLLLALFPLTTLLAAWCVTIGIVAVFEDVPIDYYTWEYAWERSLELMPTVAPIVCASIGIWYAIAYFSNVAMIRQATGARPLERTENPRVYNIVENLTMACGMEMPKVNIVDDPQLNAFASGVDTASYTVTVTSGLLDTLDDAELEGVIGHELTHIRNRDTRLLITSIVFVGIFSTLMSVSLYVLRALFSPRNSIAYAASRRSSKKNDSDPRFVVAAVLMIVIVVCFVAYVLTSLTRFAISRKREFMADAGSAELTGNPLALASALRKITNNPGLDNVGRPEVAQLFIMKPDEMKSGLLAFINKPFSTHPDPEERIRILEQF